MEEKNCISYWFPILDSEMHGSVPETVIVQSPEDLLRGVLDDPAYEDYACFWDFIAKLRNAGDKLGYPCFLRTGHTSGKHQWGKTCLIESPGEFPEHVYNLVEFSACATLIGLPCDVFAVRQWLPGKIYGYCPKYQGMPVRREFRAFVRDGEVECIHPYWPVESLRQGGCSLEEERILKMNSLIWKDRFHVRRLASKAAKFFQGYWSVDCLSTDIGWMVTDMALGEQSWHWPECDRRK